MDDEEERQPLLQSGAKNETEKNYSTAEYGNEGSNSETAIHISKDRKFQRAYSVVNQVTLSWHHVNVYTNPRKRKLVSWKKDYEPISNRKHILKDVSGEVKPGQFLAIMGSSGAGKTTLMNVLTGRNLRSLEVSGTVMVNGQKITSSVTSLTAYVQQDDLFIGTLTVKEQLIFQAMLRMDKKLKYKERMKRVREVISELGLGKCAETVIGIPGSVKGISGGERKRLAFAAEVLTNPSLMFCDEPTSGLDSFMSQNVVSVLRDMALGGRTIICTIHQPSSEVYAMFHHLLLMAEGRVAYMGESGDALAFFERLGLHCPVNYNPADFFIHTLAIIPSKEEECRKKVNEISDKFAEMRCLNNDVSEDDVLSPTDFNVTASSRYKASWFAQMRAVMWRSFLNLRREPELTTVRLVQSLAIAIVLGLIYWQQEVDQKGIMNINGALFLVITNLSFQNTFAVINVFCLELPVFLREHWNGMYRADVYFLCKSLAEVPVFIILPILSTTVIYWMVGLYNDGITYLVCLSIAVLISNTAISFGYLVSCLSSSVNMALSVGPPLMIPLMLFGGFFLNNASVPIYFIWIKYLSWFYYGNEALVINQWRWVDEISCDNLTSCIPDGKTVLKSLNFEEDNFYQDIGLLFALIIFFRILAFLALFIRASRKT